MNCHCEERQRTRIPRYRSGQASQSPVSRNKPEIASLLSVARNDSYFSSSFICLNISSNSAALLSVVSSVQLKCGICLIFNLRLKLWLKLEERRRRPAKAVPAYFSGKTETPIRAYFKSGEHLTWLTVIRPFWSGTSLTIKLASSSRSCSLSCSILLGIIPRCHCERPEGAKQSHVLGV